MNPYRLDFDILGAAHKNFPLKMVANNLPNPCGVGMFGWQVFGQGDEKQDKKDWVDTVIFLLETKKVRLMRFHAHWSDHKETPPLASRLCPIPYLKDFCRTVERIAKEYKRTDFYISHTAEYAIKTKPELIKRTKIIKDFAPSCGVVANPLKGIMAGKGVIEESHHDVIVGAGQGVSLDGKDATDVRDVQRWLNNNRQAVYRFLWIHSFNLRIKGKTPPPRPERTVKVTKAEMEWLCSFKG